ncbi:nitroreductase [Ameyamaea chiangmaiensis NBRC 103196]|uniref:Nitroreductase family protein n=1 Tax=Ameyamaea chiangmaiensis TaxID=442969 RepID=A0A850PAG1_9PROT|nr:nitroreductase family protein [Ameyamaea chiangmaiensis]MBS4073838.1 nitroreductase family protein [Ameyamaea chiangmaiensis]NVN41507.1 nitroreductase family protein [Ameyamaea chiangmaiensis]GBQ68238.1 nitroreductase [Ameyamaea chiangmaiensis NBRC 103196]
MTNAPERATAPSVNRLFVDRWSPRAFAPDTLDAQTLLGFLEAGRWAPSAYNSQPWRFFYALRGTPAWSSFLSWLIPFNQSWAGNAAALVFVASRNTMVPPEATDPVDAPTHAYDTGAAAVQVMLQATHEGWAAHAMSGIDAAAAHAGLKLGADVTVLTAIAIGKQGDKGTLPEYLQGREAPSDRLPLEQVAFEGGAPA